MMKLGKNIIPVSAEAIFSCFHNCKHPSFSYIVLKGILYKTDKNRLKN